VLQAPSSAASRLNGANVSNFLHFRRQRFDCPICGKRTTPLYDFPDVALRREHKIGLLRETLQCRHCLSSMRQRTLAVALLKLWHQRTSVRHTSIATLAAAGLGGVRVLDSDNFSAISQLLREDPDYVRCSYLPEKPWGIALQPNYYNINLENIDFADASFDIVLTSDVMEHVRDSDAAHAEIHRILRPGGAYVFTVPYDEHREQDIQLVDTTGTENVYLCEPHYHGDPLTGGILAYRIFGRQLITKLQTLGFKVDFERIEEPGSLVTDGDVFLAVKAA
jgi:SAM-dependent methyltransferase